MAPTPDIPSTSYNLGNTYGAIFISGFLSAALWGTTCSQTFVYIVNYPKDRHWIKILVAWLWLMDTTHQILVIKALYDICISGFGNVAALAIIPPDFVAEIIFTVLVSSTAQLFFTYRIWLFSGKKWIFPVLITLTVASQIAIQAVYMAGLLINGSLPELKKQNGSAIAYNVIAAATDIFLACCMIYLLRSERTSTVSGASNRLIERLVIFSLNSGFWTALVAFCVVITLVAVPLPDLVFPAVYTMLCPIYCNTVLANLNSRKFLKRTGRMSMACTSLPMDTVVGGRPPQFISTMATNSISIQVDTTKVTDDGLRSDESNVEIKIDSEANMC